MICSLMSSTTPSRKGSSAEPAGTSDTVTRHQISPRAALKWRFSRVKEASEPDRRASTTPCPSAVS